MHLTIESAILWTSALTGLACLVVAGEQLVRPQDFREHGVRSWEIGSLHDESTAIGPLSQFLHFFLNYRNFRVIQAIEFLAAGVLLFTPWIGSIALIPVVLLLISYLAGMIRNSAGHDGAGHMRLVLICFLLGYTSSSSFGQTASIAFIFFTYLLSYFVAGLMKLVSPDWRSGAALHGILGGDLYGNRSMYNLLTRRPFVAFVLSWGVILGELALPVLFLFDVTGHLGVAIGMGFHLGTALIMRLNTFLFSFAAGYPILVTVNLDWFLKYGSEFAQN